MSVFHRYFRLSGTLGRLASQYINDRAKKVHEAYLFARQHHGVPISTKNSQQGERVVGISTPSGVIPDTRTWKFDRQYAYYTPNLRTTEGKKVKQALDQLHIPQPLELISLLEERIRVQISNRIITNADGKSYLTNVFFRHFNEHLYAVLPRLRESYSAGPEMFEVEEWEYLLDRSTQHDIEAALESEPKIKSLKSD